MIAFRNMVNSHARTEWGLRDSMSHFLSIEEMLSTLAERHPSVNLLLLWRC